MSERFPQYAAKANRRLMVHITSAFQKHKQLPFFSFSSNTMQHRLRLLNPLKEAPVVWATQNFRWLSRFPSDTPLGRILWHGL